MPILQEANASSDLNAPSQSAAFPNPVTAGSAIHVVAHWYQPSSNTCTFSDSQGNTYTILDTLVGTNTEVLVHAYAENVVGGATTVEVAFAQGSAQYPAIWAREIGDVTASPLLAHAIGKAAATSETVSASNASEPAIISAFGFNEAGSSATTPAATSPLVQDATGWNFSASFANLATSAHKVVAATGSQSAGFTASALGDGSLFALMAIFAANPIALAGTPSDTESAAAALVNWQSLAEWDAGSSAQSPQLQRRVFSDDGHAKCLAGGSVCLLHEILPLTLGSGTLTIEDRTGAIVFTATTAQMTQNLVIPVDQTGTGVLTITSFPTGGEYGISWEESA